MPQFIKKHTLIIVVMLAIALIALAAMTTGHRDNITRIEGLIGDIITPVQGFMYGIATNISNTFHSYKERRELAENYKLLVDRAKDMEYQLLDLNEIKRENERLKDLLGFNLDQKSIEIGARITGKNPGNWFNVFTIDMGFEQGIRVESAVVTEKGLVGRVIDVGRNWAKVRAIVDGQSSVSGIVERTRDIGMVRGNNGLTFEDGLSRMVHIPLDSDIRIGDRIITSGLGEIFPKGILIGEVVEVIHERRDLFKTAVIQPGADFRRLEEVLVIQIPNN